MTGWNYMKEGILKDEYTITIQRQDSQIAPTLTYAHSASSLSVSHIFSPILVSIFFHPEHSFPSNASSFFPFHTRPSLTWGSRCEKDYRRQIWIIKEENYYKVYLPGSTRQQFIYLIFTYSTVTMCGTELLYCIQGLIRAILTLINRLLYSTYFYYCTLEITCLTITWIKPLASN